MPPTMAPGYRSPFNHLSPHKPSHATDAKAILPLLAVLLCVFVVICLVFFTPRAATNRSRDEQHQPQDNTRIRIAPSRPEMALDQASVPNRLATRTSADPRRATSIGDIFPCHGSNGVDNGVLQPLLHAEIYGDPSGECSSVAELAAPRDGNVRKKGSMNWHGTNTLNTSWGWMA
ncbi:hypothetical protein V8C37DRAFT_372217 [Trichoderma ceciliae]